MEMEMEMEKIGTGGASVQDRGSDSGISRLLRSIRGQKKSKKNPVL